MSDRDNITLPREVADYLMEVLEESPHHGDWSARDNVALAALRTALAAEQPKQEPVAWQERHFFPKVGEWTHWYDCRPRMADYPREQIEQNGVRYQWRPLYPAPPDAPTVKESLTHPGYIIGNHWFETAYERLCAGEAEDAILEDYELVREPRLRDLRRDAERLWEALKHYGKHDDDCGDHDAYNSESLRHCSCGLDAVLDETLGEKR